MNLYVLRGEQYEEVPRSVALPGIDLEELVLHLEQPTTSAAIRAYRAALAQKR